MISLVVLPELRAYKVNNLVSEQKIISFQFRFKQGPFSDLKVAA